MLNIVTDLPLHLIVRLLLNITSESFVKVPLFLGMCCCKILLSQFFCFVLGFLYYGGVGQESLIDASEDSQLEAAIRASLQETHFDSSQGKQENRSDEESESELFSGSEEFISVCGSEEEEESENPAKSRKSPHKDLGYKKEESRRPQPEPPARTDPGTTSNHRVLPCLDAGIVEELVDKPESAVEGLDVNGEFCHFLMVIQKALHFSGSPVF